MFRNISQKSLGKRLLFAVVVCLGTAVLLLGILIPFSKLYPLPVISNFVSLFAMVISVGLYYLYRFIFRPTGLPNISLLNGYSGWRVCIETLVVYLILLIFISIQIFGLDSLSITGFDWKGYWVSIQAATMEEMFFRGFMLHTLLQVFRSKTGNFWSLVFVASIFGLIHLANALFGQDVMNLNYVLGITAGGLFLGALFVRYGILASMILHWLWNSQNAYQLSNDKVLGSYLEHSWLLNVSLIAIALLLFFLPKKDQVSAAR